MAFFFSDNPIALFLALVVVVAVLRLFLGKHKWFQGNNSSYILPVLIVVVILLIAYRPLLSMMSFGLPFLALLVVFLFAIGALFFALGYQKPGIGGFMKKSGIVRVTVQILIICIIAFAASNVFGQKMLEDPSVSIVDSFATEKEPVEVDFSPLFTKQAIGMIMLVIVIGLAFVFINLMR
jgi:hypothetical protein